MKKAKRPYNVNTETCSAFYETLEEAITEYNNWIKFYSNNTGYGKEARLISLTKNLNMKSQKILKLAVMLEDKLIISKCLI
jgi:hypothetical protein